MGKERRAGGEELNERKLVGIFAAGRNGSTLLLNLLDGSPNLWVYPVEVNYLSVFCDLALWGRVMRRTRYNSTTHKLFLRKGRISARKLLGYFSLHFGEILEQYASRLNEPLAPAIDLRKALEEKGSYTIEEFLPALLETSRIAYGQQNSRTIQYRVFKTIETPYVEDFERVFPNMRFIHLVRHPLTNYSSLKRVNMVYKQRPFWHHGGDELETFLEKRWIPHVQRIVRWAKLLPEKHYVVRYEDLCEDPKKVIGRICDWLGVDLPEALDSQTFLGGRHMRKLPASSSQPGVETPERVTSRMNEKFKYEDVLTERERKWILFRTFRLGRLFGYFEPQDGKRLPSRLLLAREWAKPDSWETRNSRSQLEFWKALLRRRWYIYGTLLLAKREALLTEGAA